MNKKLLFGAVLLCGVSLSLSACNFLLPSNSDSGSNSSGERKEPVASEPIVDEKAGIVTYGMYPHSRILDEKLISDLEKLQPSNVNDWYYHNGDYYAKLVGKVSATNDPDTYHSNKFINGETIVVGKTYWFRVQAIQWKIVSSDNDKYVLMTSAILNLHRFDASTNNYANSEVRAWLNNSFLPSIFALSSIDRILTNDVDNSASQTDGDSANSACDNTQDKMFLPSYKDMSGASFGNLQQRDFKAILTDYAFAQGAYKSADSNNSLYRDCGQYWLRSPSKANKNQQSNKKAAWFMNCSASLLSWDVDTEDIGVRPMISVAK